MKVVILCGGMGMRLREETEYRPKPLVQIGGRPIVWHIMKHYAHFGFKEFVLALGYRGEMIKEYFLNYDAMNNDFTMRLGDMPSTKYHDSHGEQDYLVTLAETGLNSMTGGRLRRLARHIDGDTFMLTYGDGLADLDVKALLAFHKAHGKLATVSGVRVKSRYGILDLDTDSGSVKRFAEKPQLGDWSSAGFFVLNKKIIDYIPDDATVLEEEPLRQLANEGQLVAYQHTGCFYTMDTYREYVALNEMWDAGSPPWKVWGK